MKVLNILAFVSLAFILSCDEEDIPDFGQGLSDAEIVQGLKQALELGTDNASTNLNQIDGYFADPSVFISYPAEIQGVVNTLEDFGFGSIVTEFERKLNRAAEDAAGEAAPIFVNSIKSMSIGDAKNILFGDSLAATQYFVNTTQDSLFNRFEPKIENSLNSVGAADAWETLTSTYNNIPFIEKEPINTDLASYTTDKALDGLFLKVGNEEKKIRKDPAARVTDILRKVFSEQD